MSGTDDQTTGEHTASEEPGQGVPARQAALTALLRIHAEDAWASPVVDAVLNASGLDARDRGFMANLVFNTLRWEGTLDWILSHVLTRGADDVEVELLDILRLGTWELRYGHAPSHAVVHAYVEVARAVVGQRATGFVNGVLRNVGRKADGLPWPPADSDEGLGLRLGYPTWIVSMARERFGDERLEAVLQAGNEPAPLILRAVAPREDVIAALARQGVESTPGELSPDAVLLTERHVPTDLEPVRDGTAIVQDQSSQVIGWAAAQGVPTGGVAIDLCAAPGGKTTHLAQQGLVVTAVDRHAGRLRRTAALAARLGMDVTTLVADGAATGLPEGQADLVLVDAPCSGLGVVRRRPELRWRRGPESVGSLHDVQVDLLRAAIALTRPGGRVAYSVCTWTSEETDQVVASVMADGTVRPVPAPTVGTPTLHGVQLSPDTEQGDGMYLALLERST